MKWIVSLLILTGCTSAELSPQQRAGMIALGSQMMYSPPPAPVYRPTRCYTRQVYNQLVTNCY